uniref:ATP synthase CFO B chain subunit I n=1 Tax=Ahnfeltia plicata TaxID=28023 RepID=A0A1C9CAV8_9FLOR|nr:ATP synthase CFO B chain subunit I [Ahnfeltia plicata]AOM65530.1 ATP synthase CFO B chain subunit I [Ahnfeltia plicata]UAT97201.1 ATP synthase CFO B chain subunit I [Ahnfeltia plicata]UAT97406.1 ATP synthase CFO B chain subunit I [Ahnfeltia plicata]
MKNIIQIFNIIAEHQTEKGFGFNSDFLEANVINILLLLAGLIYVLRQFLGSSLASRQEKVLFAIQESEERLQQANIRLTESEKQLAQTQMIIDQIKKEAEITAQKVRESILAQGKLDIERLIATGKASITTAENQVRQQIQQQITTLALKRVTVQLKSQMSASMQAKIIDANIMQLGGTL